MDIRPITMQEVRGLCARYHGYGSSGKVAVYAFGVFEGERLVAAYAWQPPAPGAAKSVSPNAPHTVLALSRMVAVPKAARLLKHVSKPLRVQTKRLIDRTRWPVLVTYSDSSLGHTGYVYQCAGWQRDGVTTTKIYENAQGERTSRYSAGKTSVRGLTSVGTAEIQRWTKREVPAGDEGLYCDRYWERVPVPGKFWRSGNQAHTWVRRDP